MKVYGVRGWGSAIAESMLALVGEPYEFVDVDGFDEPGDARERLAAVNPLRQVPTLVLDDGEVLTETAAIALWLAERHPALAPSPGTSDHARFLRLLIWIVANVYPTFTYGDYPERWCPSAPNKREQRSVAIALAGALAATLVRSAQLSSGIVRERQCRSGAGCSLRCTLTSGEIDGWVVQARDDSRRRKEINRSQNIGRCSHIRRSVSRSHG